MTDQQALAEHEAEEAIYAEIDSLEQEKNEELKDPVKALEFIKQLVDEEWDVIIPTEVLEVVSVRSSFTTNLTKVEVIAKVKCNDGSERQVEANYDYWSGNNISPPEEDGYLEWV